MLPTKHGSKRGNGSDRSIGSLDVVINNAGYGNLSSIKALYPIQAQIETANLFKTIIVTKAALTYFREKENRPLHSVFVGGRKSGPQDRPRRRNGVSKASLKYCRAKWHHSFIKVTIIDEPGGFHADAGVPPKTLTSHLRHDSTVGAAQDFSATGRKQPN